MSGEDRSVKWDEQNLEVNEQIKAQMNTTKIEEPKTPYRSPMESDNDSDGDGHEGLGPLQYGQQVQGQPQDHAERPCNGAGNGTAGSEASTASGTPEQHGPFEQGHFDSSRFNAEVEGPGPSCSHSVTYSDADDARDVERHQRFQQLRKQHYNMRDALCRAKDILEVEKSHPPDPGSAKT